MRAEDLVFWAWHHSLTRQPPKPSVSVLVKSSGPDKESETHFSPLLPATSTVNMGTNERHKIGEPWKVGREGWCDLRLPSSPTPL